MAEKIYNPLIRSRYYLPYEEVEEHTGEHHLQDYREYHIPLVCMHHANLHGWGIARGLEVNGAVGSPTLVVQPGVAIDRFGQLISLAREGHCAVGANPPSKEEDMVPVGEGIALTIASETQASRTLYVTIEEAAVEYKDEDYAGLRVEQTPWVRLQSAAELDKSGKQEGEFIVLALAETDTDGHLVALKEKDDQLPYRRRLLGERIEELQINRPAMVGEQVSNVLSGKLGSGKEGGLRLTVTDTGDTLLLAQENEADGQFHNFAKLEVKAETVGLLGRVGIGTDTPMSRLDVKGGAVVGENYAGRKTAPENGLLVEGGLKITDATCLEAGDKGTTPGALRIVTQTGWTEVGSTHEAWSHFWTDRPKFYFQKEIRVDTGRIGSYDEDLSLCTAGEARLAIQKGDGNVGIGTRTPEVRLHVEGGSKLTVANSKSGFVVLGKTGEKNLALDINEIQARDNEEPSDLYLQRGGGALFVHASEENDFIVQSDGCVKIGRLNVSGATYISGSLTAKQRLSVSGDTDLSGRLTVTKAANLKETLTVEKRLVAKQNLRVSGDTDLSGCLTVTKATNLKETLTVEKRLVAKQNLRVSGDTDLSGRLTVTKAANLKETLTVEKRLVAKQRLSVSGDTDLSGRLTVAKATNLDDLYIDGVLHRKGKKTLGNIIGVFQVHLENEDSSGEKYEKKRWGVKGREMFRFNTRAWNEKKRAWRPSYVVFYE